MKAKALLAFALMALSLPAGAQEQAADDITNRIVNVPAPAAFRVDGLRSKPRVRNDESVQGGKALRIAVPGRSENAWTVAAASTIDKPVKAGDNLVLAFWARLQQGEDGATSASLPYNAIQLSSAPYTALFHQGVTIGPEWKLHEVRGKADKDYEAGALNATLHLATGRQTIDLGPMFVLNMGQGG